MAITSSNINVMVGAAEKAARSLLRDYNEVDNLQVSVKGPHDFVSAADRRAEEIIYKELSRARPSFGFIMEESGVVKGEDGEYTFCIDPLDGTDNFLHGIPHWAISIGLLRNGEPVAGVIYDATKDELFHAERGSGAFMRKRRLRVSGRKDIAVSRVGVNLPSAAFKTYADQSQTLRKLQDNAVNLCSFRSCALDLAYVAAGRLEACVHTQYKSWDYAAGVILVREAGGFVHSLDAKNKDPVTSGNGMAANGAVDQALLKILQA
ncbi:MAG: inositol monophosphatase family protein [Pseudomonadota bacterium]